MIILIAELTMVVLLFQFVFFLLLTMAEAYDEYLASSKQFKRRSYFRNARMHSSDFHPRLIPMKKLMMRWQR